ncbi:hypothetical protein L596_001517 [Steinernema carpocapsae]|uniref:Uncharacterized protein n=1 Tax=Steinernema carpocapsae TaxID=34508 RepID=A0A4U8UNH6_STECR|nr:hypothetical protein L596_001517 [Steinernema carpocapsae]
MNIAINPTTLKGNRLSLHLLSPGTMFESHPRATATRKQHKTYSQPPCILCWCHQGTEGWLDYVVILNFARLLSFIHFFVSFKQLST